MYRDLSDYYRNTTLIDIISSTNSNVNVADRVNALAQPFSSKCPASLKLGEDAKTTS
jgi:hypothetical protein